MKKILGLDLGTNSIGWAVVERDGSEGRIVKSGSRIIPMDAATLGDFASGNTKSQTADRTAKRSTRRMRERFLLRRERLHRILQALGFLPVHYAEKIGWNLENDAIHYGTFLDGEEPKIAWKKNSENKYEFYFQESFHEMLEDFKLHHPALISDSKKIPYDWTLYYLRQKALSKEISKEELAWIILNFNQKRGYNQLRDEILESTDDKREQYLCLTVSSVTADSTSKGKDTWYEIRFENSEIVYRRKSKYPLEWVGKKRNLIVTTKLNDDGSPKLKKDGSIDYSVKSPNEDDWSLLKIKTEQDLNASSMTVGQFIYTALMKNPSEKIRGGLVRTIERKYYKEELEKILKKQTEFHPELKDRTLYDNCIRNLYRNNESHRNNISRNDFTYLILEDTIFYQRPLKSKKSLIDDCPYEYHQGIDKETGEICSYPLKCIAKSNPYFQEYRIWKFLGDLRIIANAKEVDGHIHLDVDVTADYLPYTNSLYQLFLWLNDKGTIEESELLNHLGIKKKDYNNYRWNYVADKKYPMNATRYALLCRMQDGENLTRETEQDLWHLLYSTKSKEEIDKSLSGSKLYKRLLSEGISESSIEKFKSVKFADEGYGGYSEKAIKKLLPLMRTGTIWNQQNIDTSTRQRIEQFLRGEGLDGFTEKVRQRISALIAIESYQNLPEWLACYVVYGRHSEANEITKWKQPNDINVYLNNFKQHSLRNPIVECVILETLRVVRDIWSRYGNIDEIHVEMGRDLKNPSEKRRILTQRTLENENTNIRIKALLTELINPEFNVQNVRPHSPSQQDLLRIYEEDVLANNEPDDDIKEIIRTLSNPTKQPSMSQVLRYKCWLDQKYCSPYTGQPIPLSRLFTPDYEIEHIIPQSRYFDDSFSNKVICESEVNKLKDNDLGYEFIKKHHGQTLQLASGRMIRIFEVSDYEQFIKETYGSFNSSAKRRKLLMDEIPVDFIQRQMNDSRYISKVVKGLLSNIVREIDEEGNLEREAISKNVITCNGSVTTRLKRDWGLGEVWNYIVLPRFQRLNQLTGKNCFTTYNTHGNEIPAMPFELIKGFNIKRIDHRHHAMDAIVIACTTREHVNLLNNESALPEHQEMKHALSRKLRRCKDVIVNGKKRSIYKEFIMPWDSFKHDTLTSLQQIVVSFKQNLRVLNQATNLYTKYENGQKTITAQHSSDHYAIRKSLHKDTVFGHVNLQRKTTVKLKDALKDVNRIVDKSLKRKIKDLRKKHYNDKQLLSYFKEYNYEWKGYDFNKIEVFYFTDEKEPMVATRFCNDLVSIFSGKSKKQDIEKVISQITDTGIQKILTNYLNENLDKIEFAFSAEGLELMNENIVKYNNGKLHKPIYKTRLYQPQGNKFQVGVTGNNCKKYVVADAGTNLFFAVYQTDKGFRKFYTIPLEIVIERLKQKLHPVNETDEDGNRLLFYISPFDLVYLPTSEEYTNEGITINQFPSNRIYRFVDSSGTTANFVPNTFSNVIYHLKKEDAEKFCKGSVIQDELGKGSPQSKNQKAFTEEMIKEICIPLSVNRLGEVKRK